MLGSIKQGKFPTKGLNIFKGGEKNETLLQENMSEFLYNFRTEISITVIQKSSRNEEEVNFLQN